MVGSFPVLKAVRVSRKSAISPLLVVILLGAWALLTIQIGAAWIGHQDANGAWISVAVRNYQWYGFFTHGGLVDTNPNPLGPIMPYVHHPPMVVWLSALPVLLAGYSEALVRFVAAACTLISAAALYVLARRLAGQKYALWSLGFYLFTPMMAFFGRMPDHEAPALMFSLLFAAVLVNWLRRPNRRDWWALAALTALTVWTAWGGVILIAALGVAALFFTRRRLALIMLGVVALGVVILLVGYYLVFDHDTVSDLIGVFIWRTSMNSLQPGTVDFSWGEYLYRIIVRLFALFTPTVLILSLLGGFLALRRSGLLRAVLIALAAGAVAYLVLFRNASYIHDYYPIYLAPAFALAAGGAVTLLPRRSPRWLRALLVSVGLVTALPLMIYLSFLYSGGTPSVVTNAQVLHENTEPGDLIMSNLTNDGLATAFYAERTIWWDTSRETAIQKAQTATGAAYFFHCGRYSMVPTDVARWGEITISSQCWLTRLH